MADSVAVVPDANHMTQRIYANETRESFLDA